MDLIERGAMYSVMNREADDLLRYMNQNQIDENSIDQGILDTGFILLERNPDHPFLEGEEEFGIKGILIRLPRVKNYTLLTAKIFFKNLREALGLEPNPALEEVNRPVSQPKPQPADSEGVVIEELDEVSDEEYLHNLINQLGAHIELQNDQIDPSRIDSRTRSSLEKAGINLDENNPNEAMRDLVDYVGGRLSSDKISEGTRNYYLNTLLPKIAEMYGFRQDQQTDN